MSGAAGRGIQSNIPARATSVAACVRTMTPSEAEAALVVQVHGGGGSPARAAAPALHHSGTKHALEGAQLLREHQRRQETVGQQGQGQRYGQRVCLDEEGIPLQRGEDARATPEDAVDERDGEQRGKAQGTEDKVREPTEQPNPTEALAQGCQYQRGRGNLPDPAQVGELGVRQARVLLVPPVVRALRVDVAIACPPASLEHVHAPHRPAHGVPAEPAPGQQLLRGGEAPDAVGRVLRERDDPLRSHQAPHLHVQGDEAADVTPICARWSLRQVCQDVDAWDPSPEKDGRAAQVCARKWLSTRTARTLKHVHQAAGELWIHSLTISMAASRLLKPFRSAAACSCQRDLHSDPSSGVAAISSQDLLVCVSTSCWLMEGT
eukprot:CAMPEP_0175389202 /NCGR_PEP_ID=MMETSP0095-20121207/30769_1 /TAXON_ID=311494 /ORGANISM="Alexandrium monilatum, Strain CCMP3105" /LENGTH=377 /DNA_ID=CAMNT_0016687709 /DNA_START=95 /DNA_END=1226 /DNA_ORIENTATION=+